jgi:hypothetical protein
MDILIHCPFPKTGQALFMLFSKSVYLKNAIFSICENDDIYSSNIIYRAIIEHYLLQHYMYMRSIETKSDQPGVDYYKYCDLGEGSRFVYSVLQSYKIFTDDERPYNHWDELRKYDAYKELSKSQLESKVKQFNYKEIIKYFADISKRKNRPHLKIDFFKWMIPDYSELSSFVHGGPWAEQYMYQFSDDEKRNREGLNICKKAFNLTCIMAQITYLFAHLMDKDFPHHREMFEKHFPI